MDTSTEHAYRLAADVSEFDYGTGSLEPVQLQYRLPIWDIRSLIEGALAWNAAFARIARGDFSAVTINGCEFQDGNHEEHCKLALMEETFQQDYFDICCCLGTDFGAVFVDIVHGSNLAQRYASEYCSTGSIGYESLQQVSSKAGMLRELMELLGESVANAKRELAEIAENVRQEKDRLTREVTLETIRREIRAKHALEIASLERDHKERLARLKRKAHTKLAKAGQHLNQFVKVGDVRKVEQYEQSPISEELEDGDYEYTPPESLAWSKRRDGEQSLYIMCNSAKTKIKIGVSGNVEDRRKTLECACGESLDILAVVPPTEIVATHLESELHGRFSEFRLRGEWFKPDQTIYDYIQSLQPSFRATRKRQQAE